MSFSMQHLKDRKGVKFFEMTEKSLIFRKWLGKICYSSPPKESLFVFASRFLGLQEDFHHVKKKMMINITELTTGIDLLFLSILFIFYVYADSREWITQYSDKLRIGRRLLWWAGTILFFDSTVQTDTYKI
jgi:hypothetical protein